MALAKKFTRTVTEVVPATTKVVEVPHIELNLTMEEAQTLLDICRKIGGSPRLGPRKHSDEILNALVAQGVSSPQLLANRGYDCIAYLDTES